MKQRTVLVTCVDKYMGRAIVDRLTELDFRVLTDTQRWWSKVSVRN